MKKFPKNYVMVILSFQIVLLILVSNPLLNAQENKGLKVNTEIQYTYSVAMANGAYDQEAFTEEYVDAPSQKYLMPYDRPHDLSISLYSTKLPYDLTASLTAMYQSGVPYTPVIKVGRDYQWDYINKNS